MSARPLHAAFPTRRHRPPGQGAKAPGTAGCGQRQNELGRGGRGQLGSCRRLVPEAGGPVLSWRAVRPQAWPCRGERGPSLRHRHRRHALWHLWAGTRWRGHRSVISGSGHVGDGPGGVCLLTLAQVCLCWAHGGWRDAGWDCPSLWLQACGHSNSACARGKPGVHSRRPLRERQPRVQPGPARPRWAHPEPLGTALCPQPAGGLQVSLPGSKIKVFIFGQGSLVQAACGSERCRRPQAPGWLCRVLEETTRSQ